MATKAIYITVRLDLENTNEEALEFISEVDYEFTALKGSNISLLGGLPRRRTAGCGDMETE